MKKNHHSSDYNHLIVVIFCPCPICCIAHQINILVWHTRIVSQWQLLCVAWKYILKRTPWTGWEVLDTDASIGVIWIWEGTWWASVRKSYPRPTSYGCDYNRFDTLFSLFLLHKCISQGMFVHFQRYFHGKWRVETELWEQKMHGVVKYWHQYSA